MTTDLKKSTTYPKPIEDMSIPEIYFEAFGGLVCPFPHLNVPLYGVHDSPEVQRARKERVQEYLNRKVALAERYYELTGERRMPYLGHPWDKQPTNLTPHTPEDVDKFLEDNSELFDKLAEDD